MSSGTSAVKRNKVIVIGGGVAGLTAAHELIERNFEVHVYERRLDLGGKAASARVTLKTPPGDVTDCPAEHGFRFFPGWYRHLIDTMRRIPVRGSRDRDRAHEHCVVDHLVPTESNLVVQYGRNPLPLILYSPRRPEQLRALLQFIRGLMDLGLPVRDVSMFLTKLAEFVRTPVDRREEFDGVSWWSFIDADRRSEALRSLAVATTRTLLAAKAQEASAYTIALLAVRTLFDAPLRTDSVLDGPTSEVWIKPWVLYLKGRGVNFHVGHELDSIRFDGDGPQIRSLTFTRSRRALARRKLKEVVQSTTFEQASAALMAYESPRDEGDSNGELRQLDEPQSHQAERAVVKIVDDLMHKRGRQEATGAQSWETLKQELLGASTAASPSADDYAARYARLRTVARDALEKGSPDVDVLEDEAQFYVFALPAEQMAYYVNRSPNLTSYAPELANIAKLTLSLDWMAGIQFYLKFPLDLAPGHIVFADSEWALTAIEQTQFWRDTPLPPQIKSVLSVDISSWMTRGRFTRKEAFRCTRSEIAEEVWSQLKASLNRSGDPERLRDEMLLTGQLQGSFHLDDNIVERSDRKKQAAYSYGIDAALRRGAAIAAGADELLAAAAANPDAPFAFGERLAFNLEPLLVNRPGLLRLRPAARTAISNMFLAADYVKTSTNLACMEGANEAARLAVNAILEAAGSKYDRCRIWSALDGEALAKIAALAGMVDRLPGVGISADAVRGAASLVEGVTSWTRSNVGKFWKRPG
jgi:uncharacterized protein with NAD-binding domain and iron-sulfur cluster